MGMMEMAKEFVKNVADRVANEGKWPTSPYCGACVNAGLVSGLLRAQPYSFVVRDAVHCSPIFLTETHQEFIFFDEGFAIACRDAYYGNGQGHGYKPQVLQVRA